MFRYIDGIEFKFTNTKQIKYSFNKYGIINFLVPESLRGDIAKINIRLYKISKNIRYYDIFNKKRPSLCLFGKSISLLSKQYLIIEKDSINNEISIDQKNNQIIINNKDFDNKKFYKQFINSLNQYLYGEVKKFISLNQDVINSFIINKKEKINVDDLFVDNYVKINWNNEYIVKIDNEISLNTQILSLKKHEFNNVILFSIIKQIQDLSLAKINQDKMSKLYYHINQNYFINTKYKLLFKN